MEDQLKRTYRLARYGLSLFAVLPRAKMNAEGIDEAIAALCVPLPQLIDSARVPCDPESA